MPETSSRCTPCRATTSAKGPMARLLGVYYRCNKVSLGFSKDLYGFLGFSWTLGFSKFLFVIFLVVFSLWVL